MGTTLLGHCPMRLATLLSLLLLLGACDLNESEETPSTVRGTASDLATLERCTMAPATEAAIAVCTQAMEQLPEGAWRATAQSERAEFHLKFGHTDEATADAEAVVAELPDSGPAWLRLAVIRLTADQDEAAARDLEQARRLSPDDGTVVYFHAVILDRRGDDERALAEINRAVSLLADDPDFLPAALGRRCRIRADLDIELDLALADCEGSLRTVEKEDRPNTRFLRGLVYYRLGRHADAVADFDQTVSTAKLAGPAHFMRGLAKRALGDATAGDADVAEGIRLYPEAGKVYAPYLQAGNADAPVDPTQATR